MEAKAYAKAADDFDRIIRLDPNKRRGYYQRGLAHEHGNDGAKAIADYKLALARDQHMIDARKALARLARASTNRGLRRPMQRQSPPKSRSPKQDEKPATSQDGKTAVQAQKQAGKPGRKAKPEERQEIHERREDERT